MPITRIAGCCACASGGQTVALPSQVMKSRHRMRRCALSQAVSKRAETAKYLYLPMKIVAISPFNRFEGNGLRAHDAARQAETESTAAL
jgi:hypothetical protein